MAWIQLRSRRDPAFWAPLLLVVLVIVPVAFWAHASMSAWLEGLREAALTNPEEATARATRALRLLGWSFCVVCITFDVCLFRYFRLGLRESRLPPSGWWSLGAYRIVVGATARRMSKLGLVLSVILLAATIGLVLAVERLAQLILKG